jgi:hypothetical protein
MKGARIRSAIVVTATAWCLLSGPSVNGQTPQGPIKMRAFVVNMTNVGTGSNNIFEITVDKYSTAEERKDLIDTMTKGGQNALLKKMEKIPIKGRMRIPGWVGPDPNNYRLGWDLRYAWQEPLPEGGTRLVLGTDRPMSMAEIRNQPITTDYPFTFLEIHLPKDGKGEGRATGATKVMFNKKKNMIELERYSAGNVLINEVTVEKK